ncbi:hypothetical protein [Pseudomarimonas arenosa]|uniref:Transmembrane protein n=1 Tax=Pseudomarimonas arenosa TaxID=2774145 RepID=A0AAW3ZMV8_9GAMM|nr:hypothetical protein [Pseudomarimonas arenosa]MBD8525716.1 hypothetical protein [Pseudomarimonas arenosa]
MSEKERSSWPLLLVLVLFMLPFASAVWLRFGGWQPGQTRNFGELLSPPLSMEGSRAELDNAREWVFVNQEHQWSLLVSSAESCGADCRAVFDILPNVRKALGRHAGRLHMFRLQDVAHTTELPRLQLSRSPTQLQARPAQGAEVWLVDPHGYLVMHYAVGFDPSGLRKDLSRLIR